MGLIIVPASKDGLLKQMTKVLGTAPGLWVQLTVSAAALAELSPMLGQVCSHLQFTWWKIRDLNMEMDYPWP